MGKLKTIIKIWQILKFAIAVFDYAKDHVPELLNELKNLTGHTKELVTKILEMIREFNKREIQ